MLQVAGAIAREPALGEKDAGGKPVSTTVSGIINWLVDQMRPLANQMVVPWLVKAELENLGREYLPIPLWIHQGLRHQGIHRHTHSIFNGEKAGVLIAGRNSQVVEDIKSCVRGYEDTIRI